MSQQGVGQPSAQSGGSKVRFNFVLLDDVAQQLGTYSAVTSRLTADVVRQVLIEWLDGDLELHQILGEHPVGRRTNITFPARVKNALEERVRQEGHASVSAVLNALLRRFLATRAPTTDDVITVRLPVPVDTYQKLSAAATLRGEEVEALMLNNLVAHVDSMTLALKEDS